MALVQKATGTWCAGCGEWGWELQERVIADNADGILPNAAVISAYGSGIGDYGNDAAFMLAGFTSAWPSWAVNNINQTPVFSIAQVDTVLFRSRIKHTVDS